MLSFPFIDRLLLVRTKLKQLGVAFYNEGTIKGTIIVYESI